MSLQQRKRLGELGARIEASTELSEADQAYLVDLFECLAHGEDANRILGLTSSRGEKRLNDMTRACLYVDKGTTVADVAGWNK